MTKKYSKALFVFRRDLRLEDNLGLIAALGASASVLPAFIFDPRQIEKNEYFSAPAFAFMLRSLAELDNELRAKGSALHFFCGAAHKVMEQLIGREGICAVFVNKDYSPFSVERDLLIAEVCRKLKADFYSEDDLALNGPDAVSKNDGGVYTVFTPYFRKASAIPVLVPKKNLSGHFAGPFTGLPCQTEIENFKGGDAAASALRGGRSEARKILKKLGAFQEYALSRDFPSLDATTHLSAHLKFGTCSVREVYHALKAELGVNHSLVRQLYWRDFFMQIGFHHPYVLGRPFHEKFGKIRWENDEHKFLAWCAGKTGFPIVDAGMRELNATGYMHNRARMITASFLVKDLHVDWRKGEKYFATRLVDYDPLVNNGNWQWAASTGCDAQPYFRIFNPWLQQERFDPDCLYIKKWVPELKSLTPKQIHRVALEPLSRPGTYPPPLVDHKYVSEAAKKFYRAC